MDDNKALPAVDAEATAAITTIEPELEAEAKAKHLEEIRKFARVDVSPDDVHIFATRIINTKIASFWGRFTSEALEEVATLLPGRPLLRSHDTMSAEGLPIGRFFAAKKLHAPDTEKTPRAESYWVEGLFFVPKGTEGDAIAQKIKLGVWSETSLGWSFLDATCSICGHDIRDWRSCGHVPGEIYDDGFCVFDMGGITAVREGSIVYAGAERGTTITQASAGVANWLVKIAGHAIPCSIGEAIAAKRAHLEHEAQAALDAEAGLDWLTAAAAPAPPKNTTPLRAGVVAVRCTSDRFATADEAARWLRDHAFRAVAPQTTGEGWVFPQMEYDASAELRGITLTKGVTALLVQRKASGEAAEPSLDELLAGTPDSPLFL